MEYYATIKSRELSLYCEEWTSQYILQWKKKSQDLEESV